MKQHDKASARDKMQLGVIKGLEDFFSPEVNMVIELYDENGKLKQRELAHNLVTTAGKNAIADQYIASPTLNKAGWMAIGTGSPAATLLGAEVARVAFGSFTRSGAVDTMQATFGPGVGTGAITEAGIFDVVTANTINMHMSASFAVVNKLAADTLVISWTLTIN